MVFPSQEKKVQWETAFNEVKCKLGKRTFFGELFIRTLSDCCFMARVFSGFDQSTHLLKMFFFFSFFLWGDATMGDATVGDATMQQ